MDNNYPTLKRPKKKLIYPTTKTGTFGQWTQDIVTLEDVDKIFDDLDSEVADFPSPSPEIHIPNKNKQRDMNPCSPFEELHKSQMVANGDQKNQHNTPASPELDIGSETPFKAHGPVKTSSPIDGNLVQQEKQKNKGDNSASPILFECEDLQTPETTPEERQNSNKRDVSDDSLFETLPKKPVLNIMSVHKKKTTPKRLDPSSPSASSVRRKNLKATPEKLMECAQVSTKVKPDMTSFLQKLRDAGQPKPGLAGMSQAKVICSVPEPEPEDDFLILEDVSFHVAIPSTHSKSMKKKPTTTSSSDNEAKDTAAEEYSADKQPNIAHDHRKRKSQNFVEKDIKKMRSGGSGSNAASSDKEQPLLATTESVNADNLRPQGKTKTQKKQSKDINKPIDTGTERNDGITSKKIAKREKTVKNENAQRRTTSAKEKKREIGKPDSLTNEVELQIQDLNCEHQIDPVSGVNNVQTEQKRPIIPSSQEQTSDEDIALWKRKRRQPGEWWVSYPQSPEQKAIVKQRAMKKTKQANEETVSATSSLKAATGGRKKNLKPSSSSSDGQRQKAEKKVKKGKPKSDKQDIAASDDSKEVFGQPIPLDQNSDSSPLLFPHRERRISSGETVFHKVYGNSSSEKKSSSPDCASPTGPDGVFGSRKTTKRRRKSPGNWWKVNPTVEDQEVASPQPEEQKTPKLKATGKKKKRAKNPSAQSLSKPLEGAHKQKKKSLATMSDLCRPIVVSPLVSKKNAIIPPTEDQEVDDNVVSIEMDELQGTQDQSPSEDIVLDSMSRVIRSGPSSMIALENYEEDEDLVLPSSAVQPVLSAADMCCAPLRPFTLQSKDKVNLQEWLKCLWPAVDKNPEIMPEDFEWYSHRGKVMGILVDLHTGSICNGKMLLGSFMKKPLWVDHSATTVINILTSSVSVVVDCNKSNYSAGQSFMVPPGHAYSIHNVNAQPAVLYFTRFCTEELDE